MTMREDKKWWKFGFTSTNVYQVPTRCQAVHLHYLCSAQNLPGEGVIAPILCIVKNEVHREDTQCK